MLSLEVIFFSSVSALIAYVVLLIIEDQRNGRVVLHTVRDWIDFRLEHIGRRFVVVRRWLGESAVRHALHFLVHTLLRLLIVVVSRTERFLRALLRSNKRIAKSTIVPEDSSEYLTAVKAHADSVKLPEDEKRKKRRALLK